MKRWLFIRYISDIAFDGFENRKVVGNKIIECGFCNEGGFHEFINFARIGLNFIRLEEGRIINIFAENLLNFGFSFVGYNFGIVVDIEDGDLIQFL